MDIPSEYFKDPDAALAVLVACHSRGEVSPETLNSLLAMDDLPVMLEQLVGFGLLETAGNVYRVTQRGRDEMDRIVVAIQGQLAPETPAYERRFRRAQPTLPFAANTVWADAVCVNIRVAPQALRPLIPTVFELDLYDEWAFVSLTASRLKDFGVGTIPNSLRMNFYQATYRAHVKFLDFRGRPRRGCYFIRSETNSRIMSLVANLLPEFRAHHCSTYPILMAVQHGKLILSVDSKQDSAGKVVLVLDVDNPRTELPSTSCFGSVAAAYEFIVDFYDAFAFDERSNDVFILRIDRGDWDIQILDPIDYYLGLIAAGPFPSGSAELDSIFYFRDTPYRWLPLLKEKVRVV